MPVTRAKRLLFPCAAGALYAVLLLLDLTRWADSTPIKFAAIVLCLLAALCRARTADGWLTALALALAVCADWFLLFPGRSYATGVALFLLVQLVYAARIVRRRGAIGWPLLAVRLAPLALFLTPLLPLYALALLYFAQLLCNIAAILRLPHDRMQRRFSAGLILLACCDLCVGASALGLCTGFTRIGMWLFYLPSQVCVVLSAPWKEDADATV